ncbi:alanine racemase [Microbacterium sp. SSW1-59]|uniref:alanine racemase n=1 Tax=Microbacterium xanthum TaxID=3079794 RepID=UPI002AD1D3D3|nr:alanine racemase [Microbacterium sp. SSW1-59]MDZ8201805.1 alanine racemase [Microbacterium sp. SSW1-59]
MPARLDVDLDRLRRNIETVRRTVMPAETLFVVKNDAYGHGVESVAATAAAAGVRWFGSFDVDTGTRVRAAVGSSARIFAWATTLDAGSVQRAADADLDVGVGDPGYLDRVIAADRALRVHLKIDTGLRRNGVRPEEWPEFIESAVRAQERGAIRVTGLWTHIAETSDADDDDARELFVDAVDSARAAGLSPEVRHMAASAASFARPGFRDDLVRIGAFAYGIRSADGPDIPGIVPIAALSAEVVEVASDRVTIDIGSLDGLPSTLAGCVEVGTEAGPRHLMTVGVTTSQVRVYPGAMVGDRVTLFGPGTRGENSATTLAEAIDTVGEELLVRLTPALERRYLGAVTPR